MSLKVIKIRLILNWESCYYQYVWLNAQNKWKGMSTCVAQRIDQWGFNIFFTCLEHVNKVQILAYICLMVMDWMFIKDNGKCQRNLYVFKLQSKM